MRKIRYLQVTLSLFLLSVLSVSAQEAINVDKTDGNVVSTELSNLKRITFSADETTMSIYTVDGGITDIDLTEIFNITFGDYQSTPIGIVTPKSTKFSISTDGELQIACPDGIKNIAVYDVTGKMLFSTKVNANDFRIGLSALGKGMRVVTVQTGAAVVTQKITIE